jgi:arsenite methyltransferase
MTSPGPIRTLCMAMAACAMISGAAAHAEPLGSRDSHAAPAADAGNAAHAIDADVAAPSDRATSDRRFDDTAYWAKVFDDPKRDEWQRPDRIVAALSIAPGMGVADIGAGTGYFSKRLSEAVGAGGAVFAVEVWPNLVSHLRDRAEKEHTPQVTPVLASTGNPRLPPASVDRALFVDAYHHVDGRLAYLGILRRSLRPSARVAIVEWKAGPRPFGPREEEHKIARDKVEREMASAGFVLLAAPEILEHQYVLIFGLEPPK